MEKWEYDYVTIEWDDTNKVFVHNLRHLAPQAELYTILDHLGADGWEMVNMWPQGSYATNIGMYWGTRLVSEWNAAPRYSAVFKRKVAA